MPGVLSNSQIGARSTLAETVIELGTAIEIFREGVKNGSHSTCLAPIDLDADEDDGITFLKPVPIPDDILERLSAHEAQLDVFELQLRERGQWQDPNDGESSRTNDRWHQSIAVYDLEDLNQAISLLTTAFHPPSSQNITTTKPPFPKSPQAFFTSKTWQWDAEWCEFFCALPTQGRYLYLETWIWDTSINHWWLVSHRGARTSEEASFALGAWEDWAWDETWREWYLPLPSEKGKEHLEKRTWASEWRVDGRGEWGYVAQKGQSGE